MNKKNHIVFIVPLYLPSNISGSEIVVRDIAEVMAKQSFNVTLLTSDALTSRYWYDPIFGKKNHTELEYINGVKVIRLKCEPFISSFFFILNAIIQRISLFHYIGGKIADRIEILSWGPILRNLEKILLKEQPNMVVVSPFPAGICLTTKEICKQYHLRYSVIPFFKKDHKIFENNYLKTILDNAFSIFTPTNTEKTYIQQFTSNKNIGLLPSSIDIEFIKTHQKQIENAKIRLQKNSQYKDKKIVLFIGNKGKGKGVIDAAEAIHKLHDNNVVFVSIGNNTVEWNKYLSQKNNSRGIVDVKYLTGVAKYSFFSLCDLFILPSLTDNFPLVFLEAWQFKKPVLTYDYYSMAEILIDGSGFLAKKNDIDDLSKYIGYILRHKVIAQKAGEIGYYKIKNYSRENIVNNYFLPKI